MGERRRWRWFRRRRAAAARRGRDRAGRPRPISSISSSSSAPGAGSRRSSSRGPRSPRPRSSLDRPRRRVDPPPDRPARTAPAASRTGSASRSTTSRLVGYPQRMRDYNAAAQAPPGQTLTAGGAPAVSRWRRRRRRARAACAPARRCRPWSSTRSPRRCGSAGPAMSMCAHGSPSATNSRRNTPPCSMCPARSMPALTWRDVGDVGVHALAHLVRQRHRPGRLADRVAGRPDPLAQLGGAHHAGDPLAQRDHLAAGQRRGLEQVVGAVLAGPRDRVGQDHPALGVGVEHLDPLAVVHGDHVARPVRRCPDGMFSAIGR